MNILLRVLKQDNKSRHDAISLKEVPRFAKVSELKEYIYENYQKETGVENKSFVLGYYGDPNNHRYTMADEIQFGQAMSLEKKNWIKLWLDKTDATRKRTASSSATHSSSASKTTKRNGNFAYFLNS